MTYSAEVWILNKKIKNEIKAEMQFMRSGCRFQGTEEISANHIGMNWMGSWKPYIKKEGKWENEKYWGSWLRKRRQLFCFFKIFENKNK